MLKIKMVFCICRLVPRVHLEESKCQGEPTFSECVCIFSFTLGCFNLFETVFNCLIIVNGVPTDRAGISNLKVSFRPVIVTNFTSRGDNCQWQISSAVLLLLLKYFILSGGQTLLLENVLSVLVSAAWLLLSLWPVKCLLWNRPIIQVTDQFINCTWLLNTTN